MSLSTFNRPTLRMALMTALVVAAGACSDQSITSSVKPAPAPPLVNANQAGMLRGTVREDGTVVLESLDPTIQVGDSNTSGAIYGNQNVTAKVTISAFNLSNVGGTKTWTFKLAVHNLLPYAVGAVDTAAAPYDTVGMFVFFPSAPTVVSPSPCSGCAITTLNTQGAGSFTAPNQLYYWYHDRLAADGLTRRQYHEHSDVEVQGSVCGEQLSLLRDPELSVAAGSADAGYDVVGFVQSVVRLASRHERVATVEARGSQLRWHVQQQRQLGSDDERLERRIVRRR